MEIVIIAVLIFFNAMFVASEFAIVSAPRVTIEGMAQAGSAKAERVLRILKDPIKQDQYIATAQVGITIASLGLGMYGEQTIAHWLESFLEQSNLIQAVSIHALSSAFAIFILTYFHIVLGEMVPKSLALQSSQAFLFLLVMPMSFFTRLFWPLIKVLNGASNLFLRSIGIDRTRSNFAAFTPEEIEFIVQESETEGILSDQVGTMIKQLFDFGERIAEDIMVPRVKMMALPMRPTASQIRDLLKNNLHTRYPVYQTDKDNIVGAVHIKDLGALVDSDGICALSLRPLPFLPCSAPIQTVLDAMKEYSTHMAIVLDEYGGTAGFITIRDIFEEVLGEYESTHEAEIEKLEDGSLRVAGTVRLDEVSEHLEIDLTHEDVTTVSGLVLDQLNRPPREGERIEYEMVSISVVRVEGRAAQVCLITKLPEKKKNGG